MASTYVNDLRLNEMATGDASGSWGTVTNTNLELIGEAFSYGTETIGDADSTLTIADGAADAARSFYLKITSSVDLTTTRIVTLAPNTVSKVWMIENATTGSQVITIKQGSGATINVPNGQVKMISTDGAGSGGAVLDLLVDVDLTGTTTLVNLDVSGTLGVTGVLTATSLDISGDIDVDGTTNLDVVDIDGAVDMASTLLVTGVLTTTAATVSNGGGQFNGAINVGVDDTGYDVKFFGATAGAYMLWDESADDLILGGAAGLSVNSTALVTGVLTTTAATVFNGGFDTGDLNTGLYFPAADEVGLTVGGTQRLNVSATGIDVTGTATMDGLTVSGNVNIADAIPILRLDSPAVAWAGGEDLGGIDWYTEDASGDGPMVMARLVANSIGANTLPLPEFTFQTSLSSSALIDRLKIHNGGDISFYEDTGTTPKLFWDASEEILGIGTSSPTIGGGLTLSSSTTTQGFIDFKHTVDGDSGFIGNAKALVVGGATNQLGVRGGTSGIAFSVGSAEAARIDSSGNVGIGTAAPESIVHIKDTGNVSTTLQIEGAATGYAPVINFDGIVAGNADYLLGEINGSWDTHTNVVSAVRFESGADTTNKDDGLISFWTSSSGPTLAERMRIDSSGNVVVGGTSAQASDAATLMADGEVTAAGFYFSNNIGSAMNDTGIRRATTSTMVFDTASTERMRIDSSGNVGIGVTPTATYGVLQINGPVKISSSVASAAGASAGATAFLANSASVACLELNNQAATGYYAKMITNGASQVGSISYDASATAYNTSSDYRLKTDAQPMTGASARVQALKPVNFEWISSGERVDGFLAHEAQEVVPECVTGTKDAMRDEEYEVTAAVLDADGTVVTEAVMGTRSVPDMQGIDQSKLVPLLTAALQEALIEITALKARVTALEG
jgi:hypothetical protein